MDKGGSDDKKKHSQRRLDLWETMIDQVSRVQIQFNLAKLERGAQTIVLVQV